MQHIQRNDTASKIWKTAIDYLGLMRFPGVICVLVGFSHSHPVIQEGAKRKNFLGMV